MEIIAEFRETPEQYANKLINSFIHILYYENEYGPDYDTKYEMQEQKRMAALCAFNAVKHQLNLVGAMECEDVEYFIRTIEFLGTAIRIIEPKTIRIV